MNLRLPETLATGLKQLSRETGKSQQLLARESVEVHLRDYRLQAYPTEIRHAIMTECDAVITQDRQLINACTQLGIATTF